MSKIIELTSENVKRLSAVQHCSVVIVDGAVEGVVAEVAEEAAVA